jgi:hypothetical protein
LFYSPSLQFITPDCRMSCIYAGTRTVFIAILLAK